MLGSCIVSYRDNSGTVKRFQFPTSYYLYIDVRFDMFKTFLVQKFEKFLLICLKFQNNSTLTLPINLLSFLLPSLTWNLIFVTNLCTCIEIAENIYTPSATNLEDRKRGVEMPWHPKMIIICALGCQNWQQHTIFTTQSGSKLFDGAW
jgi:hypothetical protein